MLRSHLIRTTPLLRLIPSLPRRLEPWHRSSNFSTVAYSVQTRLPPLPQRKGPFVPPSPQNHPHSRRARRRSHGPLSARSWTRDEQVQLLKLVFEQVTKTPIPEMEKYLIQYSQKQQPPPDELKQKQKGKPISCGLVSVSPDLERLKREDELSFLHRLPWRVDLDRVRWDRIAIEMPWRRASECRMMMRWLISPPLTCLPYTLFNKYRPGKSILNELRRAHRLKEKEKEKREQVDGDRNEDHEKNEHQGKKEWKVESWLDLEKLKRFRFPLLAQDPNARIRPSDLFCSPLTPPDVDWSQHELDRLINAVGRFSNPVYHQRRRLKKEPLGVRVQRPGRDVGIDWSQVSYAVVTRSLLQCQQKWAELEHNRRAWNP